MNKERIFLSSPHMSDEGFELDYIKEAFDTNWIAPLGKNVTEFEKELSSMVGVKAATALASGTAAIHLALKLAGVKEGDRVFCQSLTFSASANPIMYEKAIPVFIDSDKESWNMDPFSLEQAFEKYPDTKVVIVVHLYGINAKMDEIKAVCDKYGAILIEDAAESLGSTYKGKASGTIGDYGIYSFNGNKIITTSGGGMLVSNNEEAIKKAVFWATQARDDARYYQHSELGYNYRMSNVVAGIGRGQLKVLKDRVNKKKYIYDYYKEAFKNLEGIEMMPDNEWNEPNYWLSSMTINHPKITVTDIINALEKENIESRHLWKPMHLQPYYKDFEFFGNGVSEELFKTGICLPSDSKMSDEDLERVTETVKELWRNHG